MNEPVICLGISTCLLGEPVRYDGGHKLDHFLADTLGRYVESANQLVHLRRRQ
jgi:uncharacterized protein YbbK (DUF523 family)